MQPWEVHKVGGFGMNQIRLGFPLCGLKKLLDFSEAS